MSVTTEEELKGLRRAGRAVATAMNEMFAAVREGITTLELDRVGADALARSGARSAPELCYQFPGATIISVNEETAHAIPGTRRIQEGDTINIDVSAELDGYFADTGATYQLIGGTCVLSPICAASKEALEQALLVARHGSLISGIERTFRRVARERGFSLIENLTGHGVGRHLHESPDNIPWFGNRRDTRRLKRGDVITIEPFMSTGPREAKSARDHWTLCVPRGHRTAQFEHTMMITDEMPLILTAA